MDPFVAIDLGDERGARADEAHVAEEDVDQLGKLVNAGAAEEAADAGDAGIVLHLEDGAAHFIKGLEGGFFLLGVNDHGAEFEEAEAAAIHADAFLDEKDGAAALEPDGGGHGEEERAEQEEENGAGGDVEEALEEQLAEHALAEEGDDGAAFEHFDLGAGEDLGVEEVGFDADDDAAVAAEFDDAADVLEMFEEGEADHDFVDDLLFEDALDVAQAAEDAGFGFAEGDGFVAAGAFGEKAAEAVAEFGMGHEAGGELDGFVGGADDDHMAAVATDAAHVHEREAHGDTAGHAGGGADEPEEEDDEIADELELEGDGDDEEDTGGECGGLGDAAHLLPEGGKAVGFVADAGGEDEVPAEAENENGGDLLAGVALLQEGGQLFAGAVAADETVGEAEGGVQDELVQAAEGLKKELLAKPHHNGVLSDSTAGKRRQGESSSAAEDPPAAPSCPLRHAPTRNVRISRGHSRAEGADCLSGWAFILL
jgi:hypothetical protein